ncbi:MAG: hypothetical protein ABIF71_01625 [Planctomycetota bacterium]
MDRKRIFLFLGGAGLLAAALVLVPLIAADIQYLRGVRAVRAMAATEDPARAAALYDRAERAFRSALWFDDDNPGYYRELGDLYRRAAYAEMQAYMRTHAVVTGIRVQPAVPIEAVQDGAVIGPRIPVTERTPQEVRQTIRTGRDTADGVREETVVNAPPYPGSSRGLEKQAVAAYREGIRLNPLDARLYHGLADMLQYGGDPAIVEQAFQRAVALDPQNPNIRVSLAGFLLRRDRREEAVHEMRTAVAILPASAAKAFTDWLAAGGRTDELLPIAGVSPTALGALGGFWDGRREPRRAGDACLAACQAIGGRTDDEPQETPLADLKPRLLEQLTRLGLIKERDYFAGLWSK